MIKKIALAVVFSSIAGIAGAVTVDAKAAVYGPGIGGSLAPVSVSLGGDTVFNITATGFTDCCSNPNPGPGDSNADGSTGLISSGNTNINALNGISGIAATARQMFLAGVFIDSNNLPTNGNEPAKLTYGSNQYNFTDFAPVLNQTFYIGDGLTGIGVGDLQEFAAPIGADTLLLGFVDGAGFFGNPGFYGDNRGSLEVTVSAVQTPVVPLPAGLPLLLAGLGALGVMRRAKR